ncbi:MAG: 6,7-dimethyl-8-ribityllumazine synthase [Candidatus Eremiobacteraeota bacterium]|nr:6,7-dimethyl-8-ribityllumazine synthase [Candidatus Eremiobacteraeota bacterium]
MKETAGKLVCGKGRRYGVVVSRWNDFFTEKMLGGAVDTLVRHGADEKNIHLVRVPGAWEIPLAVQKLLQSGKVDGVVALGCLIRGATPHFDYISSEVTKGLGKLSLDTGLPVTYGVITVENLDQAIERAGSKAGNKGGEAAASLIEMVELCDQLK